MLSNCGVPLRCENGTKFTKVAINLEVWLCQVNLPF